MERASWRLPGLVAFFRLSSLCFFSGGYFCTKKVKEAFLVFVVHYGRRCASRGSSSSFFFRLIRPDGVFFFRLPRIFLPRRRQDRPAKLKPRWRLFFLSFFPGAVVPVGQYRQLARRIAPLATAGPLLFFRLMAPVLVTFFFFYFGQTESSLAGTLASSHFENSLSYKNFRFSFGRSFLLLLSGWGWRMFCPHLHSLYFPLVSVPQPVLSFQLDLPLEAS